MNREESKHAQKAEDGQEAGRRKVFLSFLGLTNYRECHYVTETYHSAPVRFVQEAIMDMLTKEGTWTENDAAYVFLTEGAREKNWQDDGQCYPASQEHIAQQGLQARLAALQCAVPMTGVTGLPEGNDEKEIWAIFEKVYGMLKEGDALYLDLTHSFRSLPMLLLVLCNYAKYMKHTTTRAIYYGNFEGRDQKKNEALIIDLLPLSNLQDWTIAASDYEKYGKTSSLSAALGDSKTINKNALYEIQTDVDKFEKIITTCRGKDIEAAKVIASLKSKRKLIQKCQYPEPVKEILNSFGNNITSRFHEGDKHNLVEAVRWCIRYGLIQQGYTIGQETVVTLLIDKMRTLLQATGLEERTMRDYVSAVLAIPTKDIPNPIAWRGHVGAKWQIAEVIFAMPEIQELREYYLNLTKKRNSLNHGGFCNVLPYKTIIADLEPGVDKCFACLEKEWNIPEWKEPTAKLFLNLSNHPSSTWSLEQQESARQYGVIEDLPFPPVDSEQATIEDMADKVVNAILERARHHAVTVHVMGEMTLTYATVKRLRQLAIPCVASTTERDVTERDGKKLSTFHFVQFRHYE